MLAVHGVGSFSIASDSVIGIELRFGVFDLSFLRWCGIVINGRARPRTGRIQTRLQVLQEELPLWEIFGRPYEVSYDQQLF